MAHPAFRLGHRLCRHLDCRWLRGADEPAELRRIHDYLRRMRHGGDGDYFGDSRVHFRQASQVISRSRQSISGQSIQSARAGYVFAGRFFSALAVDRLLADPRQTTGDALAVDPGLV